MASDDKEYEQSALGKRVNELMDDGYDFGEAVKQAMSEGLKDGGSVGIEILFKPKRGEYQTGGRTIDSRATAQDYANALKNVSAGTTYQQQADSKRYARNQANQMLTDAFRSGNQQTIQNLYNQFGFNATAPGSQLFSRGTTSGTLNQIIGLPAAKRDRVLDQMAQKMLSYPTGGSSTPDPYKKRRDELDAIKAENQRLVNQYIQNNAPAIGTTLPQGGAAPSPGKPAYEDKTLLSQLTKLTPLQSTYFDPFDQLSDIDQYNLSQAFPELQSQLRNKNFVSSSGPLDKQQIFERIYGLKDGGRVGLFMGGDPLTGQALSIYDSMKSYNFSDQEIANALSAQGLYTPGGSTPPETTQPNIINSQINQGGDNFSPFNPDPNRIQSFRKDPSVMPAFEALKRNQQLTSMGIKDPFANEATLAGAYYEDMPEDTSAMTGPAKVSNFQKFKNTLSSAKTNLLNNPVMNAIGFAMNPALGAAKGIASLVGGMIPPNQRAITENIAANMGISVDDIGRVVNTGKYNDPNNVMAGYNLNQMTEETFDNRIGNIAETLANKYGMTPTEIEQAINGTYTGTKGYNSIMGKTTNLIEQIRAVKLAKTNILGAKKLGLDALQKELELKAIAKANKISQKQAAAVQQAIKDERGTPGSADYGNPGGTSGAMTDTNAGTYCFDPSTPIQMADGSTKEIKNIQLGDDTKGGEVTGVFQFKASDEIHDYKGVTVAGSHYVKEDGKFIMVKDSPISVKIDKIPVVYSLDTKGRRIFINDIEFADYNGDGVAKSFLSNAGVDLTGFDTEVLRQVENRLI